MKKIVEKFIELTSFVAEDEDGNEYYIPWTFKEFIIEFVVGVVVVLGIVMVVG